MGKFSPQSSSDGFQIPQVWRDFLTVILLNPSRFEWAKAFIGSKAWKIIIVDRSSEDRVTFSIPNSCLVEEEFHCQNK
jgi:hypothetical protein